VVDPLGGSYYIESLTNELEKQALVIMEEIAAKGGAQNSIENGVYQTYCRKSASEYQQQIESGERVIVGLNKFQDDDEVIDAESFKSEEGIQERIIEKMQQVKADRDNAAVSRCLQQLESDVRAGKNSVPALIDCVKAYATIGEMCNVLGGIWGYYKEGASWM